MTGPWPEWPEGRPGDVHVRIERLVVRGLSDSDARELVGALHAGLTAAFAGGPPPVTPSAPTPASRRARELGRRTAQQIARAGGR